MPIKLTQLEFIERSKLIHKNKYDYSLVNYINNRNKVKLICKVHGIFEAYPNSHMQGRGCPTCNKIGKYKDELEKFITEANIIHNNKYEYTKSNYINSKTKLTIICPIHGEFTQIPEKHLRKQGCPKCNINGSENRLTSQKDFIKKCKKIHGNKYDYSETIYKGLKYSIKVICDIHGSFNQNAARHSKGQGCKKCYYERNERTSKGELELLNFIKANYQGKIETNVWNIIDSELDIYLPEQKVAFEYNGLFYHSSFKRDKYYHLNKTKQCEKLGIRLIHIFEDSWTYKRNIIESRVLNVINRSIRIFARKCEIKEVNIKQERDFLNKNHLAGYVNSKDKIGLFYDNQLVALMTFGKCRFKSDKIELLRFCVLNNFTIIGGASKLFKYYIKRNPATSIITYSDRAWGGGEFYTKLGFKYHSKTIPNYYYVNRDKRENRFKYRKSELIKQGYNSKLTEKEIMEQRKIYRIYDCGNLKFIYN